jgi:hypothetical protein
MKNIFFIHTPLIALICKEIIEKENIEDYIVIYVSRNSVKDKYYFEKVTKLACKKYYLKMDYLFFMTLKILFIAFYFKLKYHVINFYTGQPKTFITRLFLCCIIKYNIFTIDEGYANIENSEKSYYRDSDENKWSKFFFSIVNKKFLYKNMQDALLHSVHYTIFRNENIFKNTVYITLINKIYDDKKKENKEQRLNILLAGAETEYGKMHLFQEKKLYKYIITKYDINKIIPHPGSKFAKTNEADKKLIIESKSIAEDIIIDLVKNYKIKLYGFNCTTLFTLAGISDDIEIFNLGKASIFWQSINILTM